MNHQKSKHIRQLRRRHHVRRGITGTPERPRLTVFRSSKHIYAQLIDDLAGVTLAAASSVIADVKSALPYGGNIKAAKVVGAKIAEAAKAKGIVSDYIQRFPDLAGVWLDAGFASVATVEAFQDAGRKVPPLTGEDQQDFLNLWKKQNLTAFGSVYPVYQWRTAVIAATWILSGRPVPKEWVLPQPIITSTIEPDSSCGLRSRIAFSGIEARSSARTDLSDPLTARPIGVRMASTITASGIRDLLVVGSQTTAAGPSRARASSLASGRRLRPASARV